MHHGRNVALPAMPAAAAVCEAVTAGRLNNHSIVPVDDESTTATTLPLNSVAKQVASSHIQRAFESLLQIGADGSLIYLDNFTAGLQGSTGQKRVGAGNRASA
jgi:hypothetical protein